MEKERAKLVEIEVETGEKRGPRACLKLLVPVVCNVQAVTIVL